MNIIKEFPLPNRTADDPSNVNNNVQVRSIVNAGLGGVYTSVNAAQAARGLKPGMIQNENFETWNMVTYDPRQIELRLRLLF